MQTQITAAVNNAAIQAANDTHAQIVATSSAAAANVSTALTTGTVVAPAPAVKPSLMARLEAEVKLVETHFSTTLHSIVAVPEHAALAVAHGIHAAFLSVAASISGVVSAIKKKI